MELVIQDSSEKHISPSQGGFNFFTRLVIRFNLWTFNSTIDDDNAHGWRLASKVMLIRWLMEKLYGRVNLSIKLSEDEEEEERIIVDGS